MSTRPDVEHGEQGFTLIELLVVVVIIGVLIAIAIPLYLNYTKGANDKGAQSDLRAAISTLETCNSDNNVYPSGTVAGAALPAGTIAGCANQKIVLSTGSTITYYPNAATGATSYVMVSKSSSGNANRFYCYNSSNGGAVKSVTALSATAC